MLFPPFIGRRPERRESWSWGPSSRQNKLVVIEAELQKLVQHDLNGLRVFHTFFHCRVTPLAHRRWTMWNYSSPTDPDCASPEELAKDEVWSQLNRVLQLRDKESLEGSPDLFKLQSYLIWYALFILFHDLFSPALLCFDFDSSIL